MSIVPASRLAGQSPYVPYEPDTRIRLRLDANEGAAPGSGLIGSLGETGGEALRRYPNPGALESSLAESLGIDPRRVVVTNGGDDAIDRVCRAVIEPGRSALLHTPTFEMIERGVALAGGAVRACSWFDGAFPLDEFIGMLDGSVRLVALVSPNNPTGGVIGLEDVRAVVRSAAELGALVLVDLAYVEFADDDPTAALLDEPNVVVVRTFSKSYGLAGLRVGYAIACVEVAGWLRTVGGPFPVSGPSLAVAVRALEDGCSGHVTAVRSERTRLTSEARALGCEVPESGANFVLARPADADWLRAGLASLGVAIRGLEHKPGLDSWVRISLPGCEREFMELTRAVRTVLAPEGVLLDLDGVVADVGASYRAAIVDTARSFGVDVSPADIAQAKRLGDANNDWVLTQRLLIARGIEVELDEVTARFQAVYLGPEGRGGLRERETMIPGVGVLRRLAGRVRLGVVTGRPRAEAAWFLERHGIDGLFEAVVCMEDGPAKPAPEPVQTVLDRLGVERAWMVGDTVDDASAASGAGVVPIGVVAPGEDRVASDSALRAAGAARVIDGLEQLERMLP